MNFKRIVLVLRFVFIFSLVVHSNVKAEICNRVVAIVNKEVISLYELDLKIREFTGHSYSEMHRQDNQKAIDARRKILEHLIDEKLSRNKITELAIDVTQERVDKAIEGIKQDNSITHEDLISNLKKQGITYEVYRQQIKNDLERQQLINYEVKSKIIIRDEIIKDYYNDHKDQFMIEGGLRIAAIFLQKDDSDPLKGSASLLKKAEEIIMMLKNGHDFAALAKQYSQGPGAKEGGDLGSFKVTQLDPKLAEIIKDMTPGDISDPIISSSSIKIIKLIKRQSTKAKSLEEVRNIIYGILFREKVNQMYASWLKDLREQAYTKLIF